MLSIFAQSLPLGWPAFLVCIGGFVVGMKFWMKRAGLIGLAMLLGSPGLVFASLFLVPALMDDCRTDAGHAAINIHILLTFGLAWLGAFGAGLVSAKVWSVNRLGGGLLLGIVALTSIVYSFLAAFSVGFRPGCYV